MKLPHFPIDTAFLIGCWLESAFWGFYTLLFGGSLYLIWTRRREVMIKVPTLVMIVMYILSTITAIISVIRLVRAFTEKDASGVLHPGMFFKNEIDVPFRIQEVIYFLDVALVEAVIVWRCYKVWKGRQIFTILPMIAYLGVLVSFVGIIVHYCLLALSCRNIIKWCNYAYGFSLATVAIANVMTAGRIWYKARQSNQVFQQAASSHRLTVLLIVESGAIVFAEQIVEFTLCRLNNPPKMEIASNFNAYFVLHLMAPQIMGIAHALIVAIVVAGLTSPPVINEVQGTMSTHGVYGGGLSRRGSALMLDKEERRNRQAMMEDALDCAENPRAATSSHFNALTLSRPLPEWRVDLPRTLINPEGDDADPARLPSPKPLNVQFELNLQIPGTKHLS